KSATSLAAYSLHSRARRRAAASSPNHSPGLVIEVTQVATPDLSMSSIDFAGAHIRVGTCWASLGPSSATYFGGARWWWTSIRCAVGGACAADRRGIRAHSPAAAHAVSHARRSGDRHTPSRSSSASPTLMLGPPQGFDGTIGSST